MNKLPFSLSSERWLLLLGHAFFLTLLAFALLFYKERLLNFDSAYYTFHLLYIQDYFIIHGRTINYFTQWLPLLAIEQGWPLKTVLLLYSGSFLAIFYLCFLLVTHGFRNWAAGIWMALALSLTFRYKFFTAISEIVISLAFVGLLVGWLTRPRDVFARIPEWLHWTVAAALVLLIDTGHPLAAVPIGMLWAAEMLYRQDWKNPWRWGFLLFVVGLYGLRFWGIEPESYEAGQLSRLENARDVLLNPWKYKVWHTIKWFFDREYAFPAAAFGVALLVLLRKRQGWLAAFLLLATAAMVVLVAVHFSYLRGRIYYMIDGYLGYIGVVWAFAFFYAFLREKPAWWSTLLLTALIAFGTHRIYEKRKFFQHRLALLEQTVKENATPEQRKFLVPPKLFDWNTLWVPGLISLETMMLTALESPDSTATVHVADYDDDLEKMAKSKTYLHASMPNLYVDRLPPQYFRMNKSEYRILDKVPWRN